MTNKAVKDAVEYYKGVWPHVGFDMLIISKLNNPVHGAGAYQPYESDLTAKHLSNTWDIVCTKQQFEDYVKEIKMKEVKFKSVPVTDMDIWDLGKAIANGGEFYCEGYQVTFSEVDGTLQTKGLNQYGVYLGVIGGQITTRQPLPWYEQEGVFPCLVELKNSAGNSVNDKCLFWGVVLCKGIEGASYIEAGDGSHLRANECKKAAEYGVEV